MAYIGKQPGTGVRNRFLYTATAGQTTFSTSDSSQALSYSDGLYVDVYLNGVLLDPANDYTATSGTSVVLGAGASAGDVLEVVVYDVFAVFSGTVNGNLTVTEDLTVDTNTLHVDSTNNRVGVGTISPETPIEIETTNKLGGTFTGTVDGEGLRVTQTDYTSGNYVSLVEAPFDDSQTAANVRIAAMFDGGGSNLAFGTSNSYGSGITNTAMFIHSSGNVQLSGGLSFSGNDAETAANALNDYEEGTWTPTYIGSSSNPTVTYDTQTGIYRKIGKMVLAQFVLKTDALSGGSGSLYVSGLPFAGATSSGMFYSGTVGYSTGWTGASPQTVHIGSAGQIFVLTTNAGTSGQSNLNGVIGIGNTVNSANSNFILGAITYPTDA